MGEKIELEEELLTIKEAANLLEVSEISVKRYVSQEIIPSVKIGGARRIIKNEVWGSFVGKMREEKNKVAEAEEKYIVKREIEKEEKNPKLVLINLRQQIGLCFLKMLLTKEKF